MYKNILNVLEKLLPLLGYVISSSENTVRKEKDLITILSYLIALCNLLLIAGLSGLFISVMYQAKALPIH